MSYTKLCDANKAGSSGETVFANLAKTFSGNCAHGTALRVTDAGVAALDASERGYEKTSVELVTYGGAEIRAVAYTMAQPKEGAALKYGTPSERYAKVVYCGAKDTRLCDAYTAALHKLAPADDSCSSCAPLKPGQASGCAVDDSATSQRLARVHSFISAAAPGALQPRAAASASCPAVAACMEVQE
jgi:hypothetical protein